jgi:hypothetical protein
MIPGDPTAAARELFIILQRMVCVCGFQLHGLRSVLGAH